MSESKLPDTCEIFCFNEKKVERLRTEVTATAGLAELFKALADDTRMKIIYALCQDELCVCDVATIIGSTVPAASHHLRYLKNVGLAKHRKQGKMVFYSINDTCVKTIVETALVHHKHKID
ncbi:transcriptional regulator, ArsR family [Desulforamulus reducens MI-1]|uniref:Transcriptional regulator, ArsR family n=1 Tax=Desulforamulus reducens (strain ATCC BAA-1160 / DSM 100696 / MI-1) TaxID=349161 RepID=A4J4Q4_DESRM|nr:metalloregulator ArsR/SmtB family transcription factor [Desulforamulus reducens]ABO50057.1 transcriptional regulator, ArsR family [Desulforamulus reducens MI-1]